VTENHEKNPLGVLGGAIRLNRMRVGLTQVQLGRAISRSGKFISEVENGKARIAERDFERLAETLGLTPGALREGVTGQGESDDFGTGFGIGRRIRDVQPTGLTIQTFGHLLNHLDRAGWLRGANLWMIGHEPFPEEGDLALVELLASVIGSKEARLRYVFGAGRLGAEGRGQLSDTQGSFDVLPDPLAAALRWSSPMRKILLESPPRVIGYAVEQPLPELCRCHTMLWIETQDVSWSDVMPLAYCRAVTRTFEKPNESTAFWYHLPRDEASRLLLGLAEQLKGVPPGGQSW